VLIKKFPAFPEAGNDAVYVPFITLERLLVIIIPN
jgi:hypothetical protein